MKQNRGAFTPESAAVQRQMFDELYGLYSTAVYGFAYYLTQNRGDADDLFQETWLRVVQNLPKALDRNKVKAWLFTITANLHKDTLRKKRVRKLFFFQKKWEFEQEKDLAGNTLDLRNSDKTYESERLDMGKALSQAMAKLPDQHRLIFILKEMVGFKQSEISEILGMPIGTVKSLMFRAVQRLRRDLAGYSPR